MKKIFAFNVLGLTAITVLAVGFFQWFGTHDRQYWAAWTYLSLMVVAFGWYLLLRFGTQLGVLARRASVAQVQWLFVHGRAISEALRVQVAWSASGLPDFVTDHYMARRSGDMAFLRQLIRAASIELVAASAASVRPTESAASVGLRWFEGQVKYMKRKTGAERSGEPPHRGIRARAGRVLRGLMRWWWLLILLLSLGLAWVSSRHPPASHVGGAGTAGSPQSHTEAHVASPHGGLDHAWLPFGVFVVGSLLFLKVGIEYHDDAVLAEEDSETYERLLPVFERALTRLAGCDDDAQCQRIIRAVGKESLDEQAEWFVRHLNSLRLPNVG